LPHRDRQMIQLEGFADPERPLTVFNNDITTLEKAIKERVFFVVQDGAYVRPPQPVSEIIFVTQLKNFYTLMQKMCVPTDPMTPQAYARCYSGTRKEALYTKAFEVNLQEGGVRREHAYTCDFVKDEKQLKLVPRVIRPANMRYNVEIGRFVRPIEHNMYRSINKIFGFERHGVKTVMKGQNASKRGGFIHSAWKRFGKPVALMLDAKRFDQHVSYEALQYEFSIYGLFNNDPDFRGMLMWQLYNCGFGRCKDGNLKYKVRGTRTSGVSNTSSGNVVLMCAMVYCYMKSIGLGWRDYCLINDGDDCSIICDDKILCIIQSNISEYFLTLGFQLVIEDPVYEIEHIEFCQSRPVFDGLSYVMVRNPRLAMSKDVLCLKQQYNYQLWLKWARSVAIGGLRLAGGIPIWQNFYKRLLDHCGEGEVLKVAPCEMTGVERLSLGMKRDYSEVHDMCRLSFWRAFGLDPNAQLVMETVMDSVFIDSHLKEPIDRGFLVPGVWRF